MAKKRKKARVISAEKQPPSRPLPPTSKNLYIGGSIAGLVLLVILLWGLYWYYTSPEKNPQDNPKPLVSAEDITLLQEAERKLQAEKPTWKAVSLKEKKSWTKKVHVFCLVAPIALPFFHQGNIRWSLLGKYAAYELHFWGLYAACAAIWFFVSRKYCPHWIYQDPYTLAEKERIAYRLSTASKSPNSPNNDQAIYENMVIYDKFSVDNYRLLACQAQGKYLHQAGEAEATWKECYTKSIAMADKLLPLASTNDQKALLWHYKQIAYHYLGQKAQATKAANESKALLTTDGPMNNAQLRDRLKDKAKQQNGHSAVEWYNYALWLYHDANDKTAEKACIWKKIGYAYYQAKQHHIAFAYLHTSLGMYESLLAKADVNDKAQYQVIIAQIWRKKGDIFTNVKHYVPSGICFSKSIALYKPLYQKNKAKYWQEIVDAWKGKSCCHKRLEQYEQWIECINEILKLYTLYYDSDIQIKLDTAHQYQAKGYCFEQLKNTKQALTYYQKSLKLYEELSTSNPHQYHNYIKHLQQAIHRVQKK